MAASDREEIKSSCVFPADTDPVLVEEGSKSLQLAAVCIRPEAYCRRDGGRSACSSVVLLSGGADTPWYWQCLGFRSAISYAFMRALSWATSPARQKQQIQRPLSRLWHKKFKRRD